MLLYQVETTDQKPINWFTKILNLIKGTKVKPPQAVGEKTGLIWTSAKVKHIAKTRDYIPKNRVLSFIKSKGKQIAQMSASSLLAGLMLGASVELFNFIQSSIDPSDTDLMNWVDSIEQEFNELIGKQHGKTNETVFIDNSSDSGLYFLATSIIVLTVIVTLLGVCNRENIKKMLAKFKKRKDQDSSMELEPESNERFIQDVDPEDVAVTDEPADEEAGVVTRRHPIELERDQDIIKKMDSVLDELEISSKEMKTPAGQNGI